MKILFLTVGDETVASTRVRVRGYLAFLKNENIQYRLFSYSSPSKCRRVLSLKQDNLWQRICEIFHKAFTISQLFVLAGKYDIVFIQKVIVPKAVWHALKARNKRIVFDFDDAIYIDKDMEYLLKGSAAVIVSNKYLKDFASKYSRNVHEIPSPVEIESDVRQKRKGHVTLGWTGSPETSRYLYPLLPIFKDLKDRYKNLIIEFVGAENNSAFQSLGIKLNKWSLENERKHLEEADIGIMPLENDEWSRSKGGYKLLLYMSKGIPCVASPVGINSRIVKVGINGYLAEGEREWMEKLSSLVENEVLRERLGEEARRTVKREYSYDVNFNKFYNVLNETNRR